MRARMGRGGPEEPQRREGAKVVVAIVVVEVVVVVAVVVAVVSIVVEVAVGTARVTIGRRASVLRESTDAKPDSIRRRIVNSYVQRANVNSCKVELHKRCIVYR